jgi:phosphatidylglycerol lysyltransferase
MWIPKVTKLRPEHFLGLLTAGMALVNLVSAVTPVLDNRLRLLEPVVPLQVRAGTRLATVLAGFALLLLASGIWRGKRTAWLITLLALVISTAGHLIKGFDIEEASLSVLLLLGLLLFRRRFQALSDTPTIERGLRTLGIALVFTLLYGMLGFYMLDQHFSVKFNLYQAVLQTVRMFTQFWDPGLISTTRFGRYFADSIYLVGAGTIGYALLALLAPVLLRLPAGVSEQKRAADIVQNYGHTVLARFCLFPDKQYFFSVGGSLIAYAFRNRTAVVLGDPIGPREDALPAVKAFQEFCHHNDWQLTFYQTLPDMLEVYHQAGMRSIKIGHEAIVELSTFTLAGGEMKPVRTAVNKLERLGFTCQVKEPPHAQELLDALEQVSNEWLVERKSKEMKFSLGWFDCDYLNTTLIHCVQDGNKQIVAFANLVDEYQNHEMAVDLMRHRREIPPGTMDFLFARMLQEAQQRHYERFNLGLSGLAGVGELNSDPTIERALHFIYTNINSSYNFKGLHGFKEKFMPAWSPRYLIYPNLASLPVVAAALNDLST